MRALLIYLALCGPATAEVLYENRSFGLPDHSYVGGWEHFVGGGVAVFDCNDDSYPDIFAAGGESPARLMKNTAESGFDFEDQPVPQILGTVGAYPVDINGDGFLDLFVLRVGHNIILEGGPQCSFSDATERWGLPTRDDWSTSFSAWWPDRSSQPTLAVGNYVDRSDPDGPFEACDENQILSPTDTGYRADALTPGFCPLSMLAARDARGRPTLRISNDRHYYVRGGYEQMYDLTDMRFLNETDGWAQVSLWGMGIASHDLNGDGRDEVMLTSMGDQLLQLAMPDGTYTAAPYDIGTYAQRPYFGGDGRPSTGWHAEFGDLNNDGLADLFISKGNVDQMPGSAMQDPNNVLIQQVDGRFSEAGDIAGIAGTTRSRGAALADFDLDGRLDLIVMNRRAPMELYRNVSTKTGHWVGISLTSEGGNKNGVGAIIRVETEAGIQWREITVGGGHAGGSMLPAHFGLGDFEHALITVTTAAGVSMPAVETQVDQYLKIMVP